MFILDQPYVSEFLLDTAERLGVPVLSNPRLEVLQNRPRLKFVDTPEAVQIERQLPYPMVYTNSENSLSWINEHLGFCDLPDKIATFKNKVRFRQLLQPLFPDYYFDAVRLDDLGHMRIAPERFPVIVKPAVGFFSMGVHPVTDVTQLQQTATIIQDEMRAVAHLYPPEVMDSTEFIVEAMVEGTEYAVDAYYGEDGQPVILNILQHDFSSATDVSDRIYMTSADIVSRWRAEFLGLLQAVGELIPLRNFPVHMELRVAPDGRYVPIEINPMRFAGWCTTDIAHYAYGVNVYEHYFKQTRPGWERILSDRGRGNDRSYALVVANIPAGVNVASIVDVDWESLLAEFSHTLEVRPIDYSRYPVLAFLFVELSQAGKAAELKRILNLDFSKFLVLR